MKNTPVQARAKQKRAALISAAQQCFAEHGYDSSTAKTIAACAGVATGTFYQYFDNKDDMLRVIALERLDAFYEEVPTTDDGVNIAEQSDELGSNTRQVFYNVLELSYDFHAQAPELHCVLEQRRGLDTELEAILSRSEARLQERILLFVKSFNTDAPDIIALNLFAMADGLVHRHTLQASPYTKHEVLSSGSKILASYFEHL